LSDIQRTNLKQLFSYIRALTEQRFGLVTDWRDYSFSLPLYAVPEHELTDKPSFRESPDEPMTDLILSVGKAEMPPCPELPRSLIGWMEKGWDNPVQKAVPVDKHEFPSADDPETTKTELFADSELRVSDLETWRAQREEWLAEALPAYNVRKIYDTLYELHSELEREKDRLELMIGDGIFETELEDGTKVCHPVVIERVSLVFNANVPCFTISDSDANPILFSKLLRAVPGLECACLSDYAARIERELIHPFEVARFDELMTSFCNEISSDCEFVADGKKSGAKYTIRRGAVLFTRLRASGYSAMLDKIIDDIDVSPELSPSLLSIIGAADDTETAEVVVGGNAMEVNGIAADVLLEKSANREQLLIAKKIAANSAVLVQGPPGTGKTHTISNIIGDLLARGQSVLVSSQTSKALDVLRDKISEPIRPLCVSVLDDNRKQLEESLQKINECMTTDNPETLALEAERIARERESVIDELAAAKGELVELVELEYKPVSTGAGEYSPKEAAKLLAQNEDPDFIPDSVAAGTKLPLFESELKVLFGTNTSLNAHEEALLTSGAPDAETLPKPKDFERRCAIVLETDAHLTADGLDYWRSDVERDASVINDLAVELRRQGEALSSAEEWKLRLAQSGVVGTPGGGLFEKIEAAIPELRALAAELQLELADTQPSIPENLVCEDTEALLSEIYNELDTEKINWLTVALRPKWKQLLDKCIINGEKCDTRTELYTVMRYHHLLLGRQILKKRWSSAVEAIGGPAVGGETPEEQAALAWPIVSAWARWYPAAWQPLAGRLTELGFNMDRYFEKLPMEVRMEGEVKAIRGALEQGMADVVQGEYLRGDRSECLAQLDGLEKALLPYTEEYPEIKAIRNAVVTRDNIAYVEAYDNYSRICMKRESYTHRVELLEKLRAVCPLWADEVAHREGVNGGGELPGDLEAQWVRCQLRGELDLRGRVAVADVQKRIAQLNGQLSGLTRDLIAKRAWSAQLNTMRDSSKRRALTEWAELVKRIGKGTGKRAEQLLASGNLRTAMKNCRRAVPVWIMPISSVAEFFEPSDDKFDVLIIDEASQADLTALIALYIAKKVIVVGDDKQVSPTPIGVDVETTAKLRQEFLSNIPSSAMYDELVSVYDLGKANYEPITLKEHFRCADDIINFSNYHTYNGIIRPLRDSSSIRLRPATVAFRVEDGAAGRKTNRREAQYTAALIKACTELPEYKKSTFGVITMLGDEQAVMIDRLLRAKLTEAEYQKRRILCGNPSYFQGDERDVIFISLVDSSKGDGKTLAVRREGYNEMYAKRYNVAASRAKDQMWVVHSLDPDVDLKSDDIRLKLIRHAADPESTSKALYHRNPTELSPMESEVSDYLTAQGFRVTARQMVGNFTVALTCEGEGGRVAVETDADGRYDRDLITDELNKQSVLERLGWRFLRLRASEYYRDPQGYLVKLSNELTALGIKPGAAAAEKLDLTEKVIARAKELVAEWDAAAAAEDEAVEESDIAVEDSVFAEDAVCAAEAVTAAEAENAGTEADTQEAGIQESDAQTREEAVQPESSDAPAAE